jgi:hypothetical protein
MGSLGRYRAAPWAAERRAVNDPVLAVAPLTRYCPGVGTTPSCIITSSCSSVFHSSWISPSLMR